MAKGIRYGQWNVTLPDETYVWDPDEMTLAEWMTVESELDGQSFRDWVAGIDARDANACQVLIWWLRYKAGQQQERAQVDFKIRQLDLEQVPEKKPARRAKAGEADPEASAGS